MNIPKQIADEMASLEAEIAGIETDAAKRVGALRDRLNIYSTVVSAFAAQEPPPFKAPVPKLKVPRQRASDVTYSYDATIAALRAAPADEGLPASQLHLDHMSRLSVLKKRGIAQKLPSGNWAICNPTK
jgi:hypothetical protein